MSIMEWGEGGSRFAGAMGRSVGVLWLWLLLLVGIWGYAGWHWWNGFPVETDLSSLLPTEEQDPWRKIAKDAVLKEISSRITLLVGHEDGASARAAAQRLRQALEQTGMIVPDLPAPETAKELASLYFPHRNSLLSDADRRALLDKREERPLVARTLGQLFGLAGTVDSRLLAQDPFFLLPSFLLHLPTPSRRLTRVAGELQTTGEGKTWILVSGKLTGSPYATAFQQPFMTAWTTATTEAKQHWPSVQFLRMGAIFYAQAGTEQAIGDSSRIAGVSLLLTVLLFVVTFRGLQPLLFSLFAIANGLAAGFVVCLILFDHLHAVVLLLGSTLIGVAVDYSLFYFTQSFSTRAAPAARLAKTQVGLLLGMLTTLLGYACLAVSPFPGLYQAALFSMAGLLASFLTVVILFPRWDRTPLQTMPSFLLFLVEWLARPWVDKAPARRRLLVGTLLLLALAGVGRFAVDDDIRRQQQPSPLLQEEQKRVQQLTGWGQTTQFFLVEGKDDEEALQRQESLADRLFQMVADGVLESWFGTARFVPSRHRQEENRQLVSARLGSAGLAALHEQTGLTFVLPPTPPHYLTLDHLFAAGTIPLLRETRLQDPDTGRIGHLIFLVGLQQVESLRRGTEGLEGVRFVDPSADFSTLLGRYRERALVLLSLAVLLTMPMLIGRYGWRQGLRAMLPPLTSCVLTPFLLALVGIPFSFFSAIALVLVFSAGIDYTVFCAEAGYPDPPMLAGVCLAALTALFSFGLLAWSQTAAMQAFGGAMFIGVVIALLLAPAAMGTPRSRDA
ncbi:MAG: hypothetical protein HQL87_03150 [Magnetococcales bacterium]|nr:hypothetical protein [Magnetococcales bacterium]